MISTRFGVGWIQSVLLGSIKLDSINGIDLRHSVSSNLFALLPPDMHPRTPPNALLISALLGVCFNNITSVSPAQA